ncbi:unnamed protein product, partial [Ixodes persulcatus]
MAPMWTPDALHIKFHPRIQTDTIRSPTACKQFVILIESSSMSFLGTRGKHTTHRHSFLLDDLPQICEGDKYHVLGDAAYPLREYLLTPFRNYGKLVPDEVNYNLKLSQTRVRIKNAFGLLKGRFRQLLYHEF